jgi:UDPglucose 6-dehydrogenase
MKIGIVGAGFVGLTLASCFAKGGHHIFCVEKDNVKVKKLQSEKLYNKNKELEFLLTKFHKRMKFSTDYDILKKTDISFICVNTPNNNFQINLSNIENSAKNLGEVLKEMNNYHLVAVKSTVIPSTTEKIIIPLLEKHSNKKAGEFGVCVNPEFLRSNTAIKDFLNPDRIVIGEFDKKSGYFLESFYKNYYNKVPIIRTNLKVAEMAKYANNTFITTKISFTNEIHNICEKLGIDSKEVMKIVSMDRRFSPHFFKPGYPWSGKCLPKDITALVTASKARGYTPKLLESVIEVNKKLKKT